MQANCEKNMKSWCALNCESIGNPTNNAPFPYEICISAFDLYCWKNMNYKQVQDIDLNILSFILNIFEFQKWHRWEILFLNFKNKCWNSKKNFIISGTSKYEKLKIVRTINYEFCNVEELTFEKLIDFPKDFVCIWNWKFDQSPESHPWSFPVSTPFNPLLQWLVPFRNRHQRLHHHAVHPRHLGSLLEDHQPPGRSLWRSACKPFPNPSACVRIPPSPQATRKKTLNIYLTGKVPQLNKRNHS